MSNNRHIQTCENVILECKTRPYRTAKIFLNENTVIEKQTGIPGIPRRYE